MKKLLILLALMLIMAGAEATPVNVDLAERAGRQFVAATFAKGQPTVELQLTYTGITDRGEACFYVFNVDETGFVIISADDRFRPVVGYSEEGIFPSENRSPEMMYYLGKIIEARENPNVVLSADAQKEWQSLLEVGKTLSRNGGKEAAYLCETKWNQNSPYNYYSPEASSGPGGRCYAGCVATAMSQVMKYWNAPAQGSGSHSYYTSYGHLSANFGATTYDWEHMPNHISSVNSTEEIEAVALLMYHCAVAVDMAFSPNGSGAYSEDVPVAIRKYFSYSNHAKQEYREYYTLAAWQAILKGQIDLGWPLYYGGYSESAGHAFVCDGYDDNDLFHFNWGWGGSSDGWFVIDEIDYANWASAITNYVPSTVYNYMPLGPANFTVESEGDTDFTAQLHWTNPTHSIHGTALGDIDKMVVCRNGEVIAEIDNPVPGEQMSYTDHFLPVKVSYSAYAVYHGVTSVVAKAEDVALGPTCPWTIEMTSSATEGWQGGAVVVKDGKGVEFAQLTTTSNSSSMSFEMPLGKLTFEWKNPQVALEQIGFVIRDVDGNAEVTFNGSSSDLQEGVFYTVENACGSEKNDYVPFHLTGESKNQEVLLRWEVKEGFNPVFFVYRDGLLYDVSHETSYTDVNTQGLFHTYFVTSFDGTVESASSNTCHVQPESDYPTPSNLRYEINNQGKLQLTWDPVSEGDPKGYLVFRRARGEEFKRIKATTSTTYADNIKILPCGFYEYAVAACYITVDNVSSFANIEEDPSSCYVSLNKTVIPVGLAYEITPEGVLLTWSDALIAEEYALYRDGVLLADHLTESEYLDESVEADQVYCYAVAGKTAVLTEDMGSEICTNASNSIVTSDAEGIVLYPNPAHDRVCVSAKGLCKVSVINLLGQEVLCQQVVGDTQTLDLHALPQGSYLVRLQGENGSFLIKLMKH